MNVKRENLSCIFIVLFVVKVSNYLLVAFLWVVVDVKYLVRVLGLIFDMIFFMGCSNCKVNILCFGFDI